MRHYHPLTPLFEFFHFVKNIAILAFLLFVVNYSSDSFIFVWGRRAFLVILIVTPIIIIINWLTSYYSINETAFHLKSGVLKKEERTMYFERIQNVHRHSSFLHKWFRVTSITFETGAGILDSKVKFSVISNLEADRLERVVKGQGGQTPVENKTASEADSRTIHFTPTRRDIIKASFTSFSFLILIAALATLFSKLDQLFDIEDVVEGWVLSLLQSGWLIALIALTLMMISVIVGFSWTYIQYGKYEISSDLERIYISKGVLNETAFSILKKRVQAIEITQPFIKRLLGLAEVKLISAGEMGDEEQAINMLYPFLPRTRAYEIIQELLPHYQVHSQDQRLPVKSLIVRLLKPYWVWLIATIALFYFKPEPFGWHEAWWSLSLLLFIWSVILRIVEYWNTKYSLSGNSIQITTGAFEKAVYLTKRSKIIEVSIERSKLQQWTGLATFHFINRAKPVHHEKLNDIPIHQADEFYNWYAERVIDIQIISNS